MKKLFLALIVIFACSDIKSQESNGISPPISGSEQFIDYNLSETQRCQTEMAIVSLPGALEILVNYTAFRPLCEKAETMIVNQPYALEFFKHYDYALAPQTQLAILSRDDALEFFKVSQPLQGENMTEEAQIKMISHRDAMEMLKLFHSCLSKKTLTVMIKLPNGKELFKTYKRSVLRFNNTRCPNFK